jgi:hypothetical protein
MQTTALPNFGGGAYAASAVVFPRSFAPDFSLSSAKELSFSRRHSLLLSSRGAAFAPWDLLFSAMQLDCFEEFTSTPSGPKNLGVFHSLSC